uniref:Uncharacterized protein n=1 Tax=Nelumbo nucifera TaxID=4432 RepID=A0A822XP83_NELNU|nr:TPA_asm: hypothetical protein HUJ06_020771 [Nelumbo nucifera]
MAHNEKSNFTDLSFFTAGGSFKDGALVWWKGAEFDYQVTLRLMKSIDLSSNNLSGEIPTEVTTLVDLLSLNLSRNHLTGAIPTNIGHLSMLESIS